MTWDVIVGDCRDVMAGMAEASVDAIVTDPPYELGFMGKAWDRSGVAFDPATWAAALRVLKPGGHLLAFGGSRTFHRIAVAIEDAGFDIRDTISWLYGSGFPKSHNLDGDWQGWGTALKPAWEPVIVARKPLVGTVARNVVAYGTGAINVDACRIEVAEADRIRPARHAVSLGGSAGGIYGVGGACETGGHPSGRWPANVILDEEAGAMLDEQSGHLPGGVSVRRNGVAAGDGTVYHRGIGGRPVGSEDFTYGDSGGASRFFYCAKASRGERNAGLEGMAEREQASTWGDLGAVEGNPRKPSTGHVPTILNHHPTVKPISLMRYLARLVTQPGGVVLDPFTGSGTTGCAAVLDGFRFVGVEQSAEYAEIARARIAHWGRQPGLGLEVTP